MALKKTSKFGATDGLTFLVDTQEESTTSTRGTISTTQSEEAHKPKIEFGATQGKKGHKAPRINMAFTPENHEWLKTHSKQLGISATELANEAIKLVRERGEL